jgi:hypothetical protein
VPAKAERHELPESKPADPAARVLCELPRGKSSIRVTEATLPSGGCRVTLCLWYQTGTGAWVPSHSLSLDAGEALRLLAALESLRAGGMGEKKSRWLPRQSTPPTRPMRKGGAVAESPQQPGPVPPISDPGGRASSLPWRKVGRRGWSARRGP